MKNYKQLFTTLLFLSVSVYVNAQTRFAAKEYLDINHFNAGHLVHGSIFYDDATSGPACEYPKGTGKHANYATGLWISGKDNAGDIRTAVTLFDSDFMPGPLDAADTIDLTTSSSWAKIWKINQSDINTFLSLSSKTTSTVPPVILEWPAKGNPYAKGNAGASLSVSSDMAPFVDVDADGSYDATKGDYPKIKGDQMLWWVINDNGGRQFMSKGKAMKVEIHMTAYAYNRGSSVDRMLFYEYLVHNKSDENYTNFRVGNWTDTDLGNFSDDLIGVDSLYRMGVTFQPYTDGFNGLNSYRDNPPITGLSLVEMPGDTCLKTKQSLGSITFFGNQAIGYMRNPRIDEEFYNYMNANNADGFPMLLKSGFDVYISDMNTSVCDSSGVIPTDKRFILSSGGYNFPKNSSAKWVFAFMATDTNNHICPGLKYNELRNLADTAWSVHCNPLPLSISKSMVTKQSFKLYPNPAESSLYLETTAKASKEESMRIIDALGKTMNLPVLRKAEQFEINISTLASGVYSVIYFDGEQSISEHFVKQ